MVTQGTFWQCSFFAVLCGLVVFGMGSAHAGEGSTPYLGIYGGMAFPESLHEVQGRGSLRAFSFSDFDMKSGPMAGAKFGIMGRGNDSLIRWLGLEIDASFIQSQIKQQIVQLSAFGGKGPVAIDETTVQLITGALHFIAKYPDGPVQPYIGAGPAVVHARVLESNSFNSGSTTQLGLSAVGGFRFKVSEHVGLFAEYKYIRTTLKFSDLEADIAVHAGVGGLNFAF